MCELGTSQTKLVAKLKPGETFGELALIRNTCERTATCIALQNNTTLRVHKRRDPVEIERVKKGLEVEEVTVESGEYIVREVDTVYQYISKTLHVFFFYYGIL